MPFGGVRSSLRTLTNATFSPDGRWVAYGSGSGGNGWVFVQPFPATGAKYQVSKNVDDGHHPVWGAGGSELLFIPGVGRFASVRVTTKPSFAVGEQMQLLRPFIGTAPNTVRAFDTFRDGRIVGLFTPDLGDVTPEIRVVLNWDQELKRLVPTK
jgi:hypothetical protein